MIRSGATRTDAFESIKGPSTAMVLFLAPDIVHNKRQILLAEGHGAVSALPSERDSAPQVTIQVMSTRTLELCDPVTDLQAGANSHGYVDVVLDSSNLVNEGFRCLSYTSPQESVNAIFNGSSQDCTVRLGVPGQMQIDLTEGIRWHIGCHNRRRNLV